MVVDERRFLTATEVERLAAEIDGRYRALIYTAAYLGLRWHEIAGLRRRYVHLEQRRPPTLRVISTIERSGGHCRVVDLGKTKAARRALSMPEFLRDILVAHLESYPDAEWVFPLATEVFCATTTSADGRGSRRWKRRDRLLLTFHCLRHTVAAFMVDDGADPLQLKRRMGHEDVRPSLDTYGHLFAQRENALVGRARSSPATSSGVAWKW